MRAGPLANPSDRLPAARVRAALVAGGMIAAVLAAPASVLAKGTTLQPWISLATVDGSTLTASKVQPKLGDSVTFAAGYPTSTKNPWVSLTCTQDGVLVYGEGGSPTDTFLLGGGSSDWLTVGGSASCTAELGDLYWKGGHEYYTYLATTSFAAGG